MSQSPTSRPLSRREAILAGAAAPALFGASWAQDGGQQGGAGLIMRQSTPPNLEFPFGKLNSFITPNELFYVRSHFPTPVVDTAKWTIRVEGAVNNPFEISYEDLMKLSSKTVPATLECAGNGRVFLAPAVPGVQWANGAVSTAEWSGPTLKTLLDRAGVKNEAIEVILEGADSGIPGNTPKPKAAIPFARSIPIAMARRDDVLLAHRMNGQTLPLPHGYPVRVVIPGWYGVASIKWLKRIVVAERPFQGYFQTVDYSQWVQRDGATVMTPLSEMQVKSAIAQPSPHDTVAGGSSVKIFGVAWTGDARIAKVEVSADGGKTWNEARLTGEAKPFCWRLWDWDWRTPAGPAQATLMARATDSRGQSQPMDRDADRNTYLISHVVPVPVNVR